MTRQPRGCNLLCHQARSSRSEYRAIAPRLLEAVSRSVVNETVARVKEAGLPVGYADARQDLEAAIAWNSVLAFLKKHAR